MSSPPVPNFRVGLGFDAHGLAEGRPLIIGGVTVPHDRGLVGHSDGDVLVHSIMDALLGAANLGDKGGHFPSRDPQYKDISSLALLARVGELVAGRGWRISNVDATILAQRPRLGPHVTAMRANLAHTLSISPDQVSVKVTTTDYMGFTGREEGIAACAVAALFSAP